jgi:hypothetical protein
MNRIWRSRLLVPAGLLFVFALLAYFSFLQRRLDEQRYINDIKSIYIQEYILTYGRGPTALDGFERYLVRKLAEPEINPGPYQYFLGIHRLARPELTVESTDARTFVGVVKFNWLLGGRYRISIDLDRQKFRDQRL